MALKVLQKQQLVNSHQVKNVICEKTIMTEFVHPFTVRLFQTFQDENRLFMLLELIQGGELWSLLYQAPAEAVPRPTNGLEGISESAARFYTSYVCIISSFFPSRTEQYLTFRSVVLLIFQLRRERLRQDPHAGLRLPRPQAGEPSRRQARILARHRFRLHEEDSVGRGWCSPREEHDAVRDS